MNIQSFKNTSLLPLVIRSTIEVLRYQPSHEDIIDSTNFSTEKANNNDFATLEKYKDKPIIVVCAAGVTAAKVASQLVKANFSQVKLLKGGMNSWTGAGLPTTQSK